MLESLHLVNELVILNIIILILTKTVFGGWVQPVPAGCRYKSRRCGKNKGSIAGGEELLWEAAELQERWDSFLEPSHHFTYQG